MALGKSRAFAFEMSHQVAQACVCGAQSRKVAILDLEATDP